MPVPILILSDAPDSGTGLGRITKDLAAVLSTMPEFRVGTLGRGGHGSKNLPWAQYTFDERLQWGESILPSIWDDFSGGDYGIIFTIWDASRLTWFGAPESLPDCPLKTFLTSGKFQRWGYFPVDGHGPGKRLSLLGQETLKGYDRILAYSKYGQEVLRNSTAPGLCEGSNKLDIDFIPHGINPTILRNKGKQIGREYLGVPETHALIGTVMANQARKDWGTWAQTARGLLDLDPEYMFWLHVDMLERYWSIPALLADFGLENNVKVTTELSDEGLADLYSACDLTILPSLGEGFGYPIAESLACGTPVIHHDHAAGHEVMPKYGITDHWPGIIRTGTDEGYNQRLDTLHNVYRPVLDYRDWIDEVTNVNWFRSALATEAQSAVEHLHWNNLAPVWKNWFRSGLGQR
jgi:glycosyltransferase involved in cell wall biosynthesis